MPATEQADQIAQSLIDKPFNQEEVTALAGFLAGRLTLADTLDNHLHRFEPEEVDRLVMRIWMRSRFGSELSDAIEASFDKLEAEPGDLTALFITLFNHLNGIRKGAYELNVRRPPKIDRNRMQVAESKGTRVYKFDIDTKRESIEYPAVTSKQDKILRQHTGRRTPGVARNQSGSPVVEQFLLGMESLESTVDKLGNIPTNKKIPAELRTPNRFLTAAESSLRAALNTKRRKSSPVFKSSALPPVARSSPRTLRNPPRSASVRDGAGGTLCRLRRGGRLWR